MKWLKQNFSFSWKQALCTTAIAGGAVFVYKLSRDRQQKRTHCARGKVNVYETAGALNQYLAFHYGGPSVNCLFGEPRAGFDFPKAAAEICFKYFKPQSIAHARALDVGCSVGRSTFELARHFDEVIGIDYSQSFVDTCMGLVETGCIKYEVPTEGNLFTEHEALVPSEIDRTRCRFLQGDACNLPINLGKFECVLACNIICRLPAPKNFLNRLKDLIVDDGICVMISPYTFMEVYTPKSKWLGGYMDESGREVRAFETMKKLLGLDFTLLGSFEIPFLIRDTAREHQWGVSHATIWKRTKTINHCV